mmetsp:Transcript_22642/g.33099  ORF Transcript_22642/g.33099 Transcript_22642/m.33099 type:complete len:339 (+) Transcript_22642:164-1180(+)
MIQHIRYSRSINKYIWRGYRTDPDRPFTLPPGEFKPKQSLGQNFLSDQNIINNIVNTFTDDSEEGIRVLELGPGSGALTRVLYRKYPRMGAIEIDKRAITFLSNKIPDLDLIHKDVLDVKWPQYAVERGGTLSVIGNLPYYISSQILFSLADNHRAINKGVFTMQLEVAERVTSKPRAKNYGILGTVFQLYSQPKIEFKIPPSAFYPVPSVDSALVSFDFTKPNPHLYRVRAEDLRKVIINSFGKRRKMLRSSLKAMIQQDGLSLPPRWATLRPEELRPVEFLELTADLYGECDPASQLPTASGSDSDQEDIFDVELAQYTSPRVWREPSLKSGKITK